MTNTDLAVENQTRIKKLEQFKQDIEKKLYAVVAVATVLGIASVVGGVWITTVARDLAELTVKTQKLQTTLTQWDQEVTKSLARLEHEEQEITKRITTHVASSASRITTEAENASARHGKALNQLLEEKKAEASKIGADDLVAKLGNGSLTLSVRAIQISNKQGNIAATIASDDKGAGFIRVNTSKGEQRYLLSLYNERAQSSYINISGKPVLSMGIYGDDHIGFARFQDADNSVTLLELKSDAKGGVLDAYSPSGKKIVYLGPDSNSGNGLVNVMGLSGESPSSHAPK